MEKLDKVIRADEAKVELKKFCSWFDSPVQTPQDKLAKAVIKQCIEIIDKLEPVEVVHGRWEEIGAADYQCSRCGFRFSSADPIAMFQYCRCGAKMDGERKDNG